MAENVVTQPGSPPSPAEGVHARRTRLRRQEILEAAASTFSSRGFYKASLAEIAVGAGITPAGLLHHFKTKEALLIDLLRRRDEVDIAEASIPERPHGLAFLAHLVDTVARNSARPGITQLYAVLSAEAVTEGHPAQEWFRGRYAGLRELIVDALSEARDADEVRSDLDVETTAAAIVALMDGLQIQWLYAPADVDMAAVTRTAIASLVGTPAVG